MTDVPSFPELLSLVDDRSAALRAALAAAPDLTARVPGCPGWTLTDLVQHVGQVQRFWSVVVQARGGDGPPPRETMGFAAPGDDLAAWSEAQTRALLAALGEAGPDAPSWTWWATSTAPMTAAAVARHQVQEAAVHAYDAQATIARPEPLPAAAAVDGVAEFLQVTYGVAGPWPHRPARVRFAATEGPSWTLDLTPAGAQVDPPAAGDPLTTIHAPASDLLLTLFGRLPADHLHVDGDTEVVAQLIAWGRTD